MFARIHFPYDALYSQLHSAVAKGGRPPIDWTCIYGTEVESLLSSERLCESEIRAIIIPYLRYGETSKHTSICPLESLTTVTIQMQLARSHTHSLCCRSQNDVDVIVWQGVINAVPPYKCIIFHCAESSIFGASVLWLGRPTVVYRHFKI